MPRPTTLRNARVLRRLRPPCGHQAPRDLAGRLRRPSPWGPECGTGCSGQPPPAAGTDCMKRPMETQGPPLRPPRLREVIARSWPLHHRINATNVWSCHHSLTPATLHDDTMRTESHSGLQSGWCRLFRDAHLPGAVQPHRWWLRRGRGTRYHPGRPRLRVWADDVFDAGRRGCLRFALGAVGQPGVARTMTFALGCRPMKAGYVRRLRRKLYCAVRAEGR